MSSLDAALIRRLLSERTSAQLDDLECFASIESTNTYLLEQAPPKAERFRVAIADHQTAGRGQRHRHWESPEGAGLYLSLAYTFDEQPEQLSSLTLAIGIGVVDALRQLEIEGISLKWPNDIVALDGKLGGILTEVRSRTDDNVTVVTGIGLNIDLPDGEEIGMDSEWARRAIDISSVVEKVPAREEIAAGIIEAICAAMKKFEALGFAGFSQDWVQHDWLQGREITVDLPAGRITGVAAGVDTDGALLVDTGKEKARVVSGSIVTARPTEVAH